MSDKWQGRVEVSRIEPSWSGDHLCLDFLDSEGDYMFSIMPRRDNALYVCAMAGQDFVLNTLGWEEYDEVCRRMRGVRIIVDLSGIDFRNRKETLR